MKPNIVSFKDAQMLAEEAAKTFVALAEKAIAERNQFTVVLAGGSTPKQLHKILAKTYKHRVDWHKVFIFLGDERLVAPYEPESNYGMADEYLLSQIDIPDENVFPFVTIDISAKEAAELYEKELKRFFKEGVSFDLLMLGMGPDGHTASLFPNHAATSDDSGALVLAIHDSPKPPAERLTLSFKALNSSKTIMLLAAGQSKNDALKRVTKGEDLPIAKLEPQEELLWFLDEAAAQGLS